MPMPAMLSTQDLAALFDAAPDAIVVVDERGVIVLANQRSEELFGSPLQDLVGEMIERLVPERLHARHIAVRSRYTASPSIRPMGSGRELLACRRDGTEFPVEISLSPLPASDGIMVSIIRDMTDRRRLEAEARSTAHHLHSAVESIQDPFALFDADDRLVLCNTMYRDTFARGLDDPIVGKRYDEILDAAVPDLRDRILVARARLEVLDVTMHDGRSFRISVRRTPEGGTVVLAWDLTEDVRREEELRHMRELAEAASTAKSEFLSSMSHELRTPLNAVLGFAQLLRRDKRQPLDERQRKMVDHVIKAGEHLLRLIDDVLDLARIEAGRVTISTEPVAVAALLLEVEEALEPLAARSGVRVIVEPTPIDAADISADRARTRQLLMNYGSNAIKYGRAGGTVTFRARAAGSHVRIAVIDDGIGIPAEKHHRIFQPFQRAGQETGPIEGTGIGLAVGKRLAELMDGRVGFDSDIDRGSTFWVELPRLDPPQQSLSGPLDPRGAGGLFDDLDRPKIVVVYIEDDTANVAHVQRLLGELARVALLTAPTAEIGIELVRRARPDVVILDIDLPGVTDFDAPRALAASPETRDIPIIELGATLDVDMLRAALRDVLRRDRRES